MGATEANVNRHMAKCPFPPPKQRKISPVCPSFAAQPELEKESTPERESTPEKESTSETESTPRKRKRSTTKFTKQPKGASSRKS